MAARRSTGPRSTEASPPPPVIDPAPVEQPAPSAPIVIEESVLDSSTVRVRATQTGEQSIGGANYRLTAGNLVAVPAFVADELVRLGMAARV